MSEATQSTPTKIVPPAKVKVDLEALKNEDCGYPAPPMQNPGILTCTDCECPRPFDQFESGTDPICSQCRNTKAERELAKIRENEFKQVAHAVIDSSKRGSSALPRLERVFTEFMQNMGGEKAFAALWAQHFKIALENRGGSNNVLQMFHSIAKVNLELSKRQQQEEVIDLSDRQLQDRREMTQISILQDLLSDPGKVQMLIAAQRATGQGIDEVPGVAEQIKEAANDDDPC